MGASRISPKVTSEEPERRSDENVLEPPSMIMRPWAVETTVVRMVAAQWPMEQAPERMVLRSLKM